MSMLKLPRESKQEGFITMLLAMVLILGFFIFLAYTRVSST